MIQNVMNIITVILGAIAICMALVMIIGNYFEYSYYECEYYVVNFILKLILIVIMVTISPILLIVWIVNKSLVLARMLWCIGIKDTKKHED